MSAEGPEPVGAGPSAGDLDELRRRVFGGGRPSAADLAAYERLTGGSAVRLRDAAHEPTTAGSGPPPIGRSASRPLRQRLTMVVSAVLVAIGVAAVVATLRDFQPVALRSLAPPELAGETLAAYGRQADPAVAKGARTYQPEGYTVFQPAGRVVHVAFRCVGEGDVRLFAGAVYQYRCTEREQRWTRSRGGALNGPFMIAATTTGDVVWSVRVVLRDG